MSAVGALILVVLFAFPYFALLRLVWYAGTYFKWRTKLDYDPADYQ